MAIVATNIKKGQCIKYNNELGIVLDTDHRTPGKGNAIILATVRSLNSGKSKTIRFASSDKVDIIPVDRQKLEVQLHRRHRLLFHEPPDVRDHRTARRPP